MVSTLLVLVVVIMIFAGDDKVGIMEILGFTGPTGNSRHSNLNLDIVVKFGLDITRIPLRTDGRWKAYL